MHMSVFSRTFSTCAKAYFNCLSWYALVAISIKSFDTASICRSRRSFNVMVSFLGSNWVLSTLEISWMCSSYKYWDLSALTAGRAYLNTITIFLSLGTIGLSERLRSHWFTILKYWSTFCIIGFTWMSFIVCFSHYYFNDWKSSIPFHKEYLKSNYDFNVYKLS